jgi:hypothetical protein
MVDEQFMVWFGNKKDMRGILHFHDWSGGAESRVWNLLVKKARHPVHFLLIDGLQ